MRRESLGGTELRFVHHALVAVGGMLDPVEQFVPLHRKQTLDGIGARGHLTLETVRHQMDRLPDLELVLFHVWSSSWPAPPWERRRKPVSDGPKVLGRGLSLFARQDFKAELLTLLETGHPGLLESRDVHEHIL